VYLRAIFGSVVVASILSLAAGCDKRDASRPRGPLQTSLANKPRALFFVFGDRSDPRVLPVATLHDGKITPIHLDSDGWRNFDHLYFGADAKLPVYEDGVQLGDAVIRRGMWDGTQPLYRLPGCKSPRPLAAATLTGAPSPDVMMELLATSAPLDTRGTRPVPTKADSDSASAFATRVAQHEGLTRAARGELDEVLKILPAGATAHPTIVGSYMERGSGVTGKPRHLFVIGDWSDTTKSYVQSFTHVPGDSAREFRRLIDHADLTGDGVDEIVLEGWQNGGDSYLIFLRYQLGHWREVARGATSWCADRT
jgi:hypothetical protein